MKISPVAAPTNAVEAVGSEPAAPSMSQRIRSLKMNTNATPGYDPMGVATPPEEVPEDPKLAIPDTGEAKPEEDTQPLSPQLAAIARQRRALQVKEREIADRERALADKPSTQDGGIDRARLKSDPVSVLLEEGVTYAQLTQAILERQDGVTPELLELRSKVKALEEGVEKKFVDRDSQQEQQALAEMQREALKHVADGDDFEMIRTKNAVPDVMRLIKKTYHSSGEVLDVREALQLVEDELLNDAMKLAAAKKVQAKLTPQTPAPQPPQQHRQTLTNRDTAQVPMSAKQRAIMAFNGQLKR